jgi:ElaB/YqjD/DUF883 family membrane-anchored ribosome-binding protein
VKTEKSVVRDSLVHIPTNYDVDVAKEKVVGDLKNVVAGLDDLLNAPAAMAGEKAPYVRSRIKEYLDRVKLQLAAAEITTIVKAKATTRVTDEYVRQDA